MTPRILLISSNSSPRGGGEKYLDYLTQGLLQIGCEVHALLSDRDYMDGWAGILAKSGAHIHRLPLVGLRDRPLRFVQALADRDQQRRVARFCSALAPDAILVNQQYDEDAIDYIAGALAARCAPVAATLHMPMTADKDARPLGRWRGMLLREWYRRSTHRILFISEGGREEFERYYGLRGRGSVIHHGTTFGPVHDVPRDLETITIGFAGQFVPQKNLKLLAEAWLRAYREDNRIRLLLIGDGPERGAVEGMLSSAPPSHWRITGWVDDPSKHLEEVDIYTMTSHFEGLPLALIEAAGQGLPAVVTNFNGAKDVAVHADWVRLADSDAPSIAAVLLESARDLAQLRQSALDGAESFRSHFSLERMARDTVSFLLCERTVVGGAQTTLLSCPR